MMFQNSSTRWITTSLLASLVGLLLQPANQIQAETPEDFPDPQLTKLLIGNPDGSNMKRFPNLTQFSEHGSSNCSLDGKLMAFDIWKPPSSGENSRVVVVNIDGTAPRVFEDAAMPSFSPGGRRVVVSRPKARGVWVIDLGLPTSESFTRVDPHGWGADWSSDGKIVYASYGRDGANLKIVDLVEGRRNLFDEIETPYRQIFWNMNWSRDGQFIAFKGINKDGEMEIGVVSGRGHEYGLQRRLEPDLLPTFAWSPDGSQILFTKRCAERDRYQIYTIAPNLKEAPKLLGNQNPAWSYSDVAYTSDGKQLLFSGVNPGK